MLPPPGHPKNQRHVQVATWGAIAKGLLAEETAVVVGVAPAVGARWLRRAGGMPPFDIELQPSARYLSPLSGQRLSGRDSTLSRARGVGVRETARAIGRAILGRFLASCDVTPPRGERRRCNERPCRSGTRT